MNLIAMPFKEMWPRGLKQLGQSMRWELRKVRKDGSMLWVRETARAVPRVNGPIVLIACEDIAASLALVFGMNIGQMVRLEAQKCRKFEYTEAALGYGPVEGKLHARLVVL
jgi:hypothetical protein